MVKICLFCFGLVYNFYYCIVVVDVCCFCDGGYIESLGYYDFCKISENFLKIDVECVNYWIVQGVQFIDIVCCLLCLQGVKISKK